MLVIIVPGRQEQEDPRVLLASQPGLLRMGSRQIRNSIFFFSLFVWVFKQIAPEE